MSDNSNDISSNPSPYFDNLLERQVEEFNQRMEASSAFHKCVLQVMCDERMRREFETMYDPASPKRQRPTQARHSLTKTGKSLLRQVSRVGKCGRAVLCGRSPTPAHRTTNDFEDPPAIIEGEFRVISNDPDVGHTTNNFNQNRKEKQP